ncbi:MAG: hypothetical protein QM775_13195 [Pirellulales bacterium]
MPTAGQIKLNTTNDQGFTGFLGLDAAAYYGAIDMSTLGGGYMFLGSTSVSVPFVNTPFGSHNYLNQTLTPGAGNTYRFGGGNGDLLNIGGAIFDNVITGTANVEVGAGIATLGSNGGGTAGLVGTVGSLTRQNTSGNVRLNQSGIFQLGNSFALGNGTLIFNGGTLANFGSFAPKNNMQATADLNFSNGAQLVLRGNLDLSPDGVGATRTLTSNSSRIWINGVISGVDGTNFIKAGAGELVLNGLNTYQGTTAITGGNIWFNNDVMPNAPGSFGVSSTPVQFSANNTNVFPTGQLTFGRDMIIAAAANGIFFQTQTTGTVRVTGNVTQTLTGGNNIFSALQGSGRLFGGLLDIQGSISGTGTVMFGGGDNRTGSVRLSTLSPNGYSANNFSGTASSPGHMWKSIPIPITSGPPIRRLRSSRARSARALFRFRIRTPTSEAAFVPERWLKPTARIA